MRGPTTARRSTVWGSRSSTLSYPISGTCAGLRDTYATSGELRESSRHWESLGTGTGWVHLPYRARERPGEVGRGFGLIRSY
ncbi:hypothetical protein EVAR_22569_1 [Eumeta japonica]|uniref:Uncharacterized protein n=1 Tax=Eumeta variegata TaxID=151549 RepID=A0A4C1U7A7_EUMVA|nr:hypothetical protein EVAR_22569_1 [Eumeta japonica]